MQPSDKHMSNIVQVSPSGALATIAESLNSATNTPPTNLLKAINEVMKETGYVQKTGRNNFHGYNYVTEADVIGEVRPAMIKHGLILLPDVMHSDMDTHGNTNVMVRYRLFHISGECITFDMPGAGNDKNKNGIGDKGVYKALTGSNKYAHLKAFNLSTGDDPERDGDAAREEPSPPPPAAPKLTGENAVQDTQKSMADFSVQEQWNQAARIIDLANSKANVEDLKAVWDDNLRVIEELRLCAPGMYDEIKTTIKKKKGSL